MVYLSIYLVMTRSLGLLPVQLLCHPIDPLWRFVTAAVCRDEGIPVSHARCMLPGLGKIC